MLSPEHIAAMRNAPDVPMSADMRRLLIEHIDEQQAKINALEWSVTQLAQMARDAIKDNSDA